MIYNKIAKGVFIKRPNRFIALVMIDGKEEIVHVKNTGRCKELLVPGAKVVLEDCYNKPGRKTRYSLIAVWKGDILINMDSQVPNTVVFDALNEGKLQEIKYIQHAKREVTFGKSRYDIYFETQEEKGFIEVKGVTLEDNGVAMFPDAPTERGTKHTLEMIEAVRQGYRGIIFFLVQMKGPKLFRLNWEMDRNFSESVKLARENGVEILAYDSTVLDDRIDIDKSIKLDF